MGAHNFDAKFGPTPLFIRGLSNSRILLLQFCIVFIILIVMQPSFATVQQRNGQDVSSVSLCIFLAIISVAVTLYINSTFKLKTIF